MNIPFFLYKYIFDEFPVSIGIFDAKGSIITFYGNCIDLFGISKPETIENFNFFLDLQISDEYFEKIINLKVDESLKMMIFFDFDKIKIFETEKKGYLWLDITIKLLKEKKSFYYIVTLINLTSECRYCSP